VPEVTEFILDSDDRFLVIATDGVWEFLSNQEVVDIVTPYYYDN
jgi:serine/threonine protein phosphatase PrpC